MTSGATIGYVLTAIDTNGTAKWTSLGTTTGELDPVISILTTPPVSNTVGDRYLISGGTGTWAGKSTQIAEYTGVTSPNWTYTTPVTDNVVYVTDTLTTYLFNGTIWVPWRGTAILQNGNSLTTSVNIGSNNSQNLTFRTSGQTRVTISGTTGNVGIGTTTPTEKLDVSGKTKTTNFQMTTSPTAGYVLTSDATGNASWTAAGTSGTSGTSGRNGTSGTSGSSGTSGTSGSSGTSGTSGSSGTSGTRWGKWN